MSVALARVLGESLVWAQCFLDDFLLLSNMVDRSLESKVHDNVLLVKSERMNEVERIISLIVMSTIYTQRTDKGVSWRHPFGMVVSLWELSTN